MLWWLHNINCNQSNCLASQLYWTVLSTIDTLDIDVIWFDSPCASHSASSNQIYNINIFGVYLVHIYMLVNYFSHNFQILFAKISSALKRLINPVGEKSEDKSGYSFFNLNLTLLWEPRILCYKDSCPYFLTFCSSLQMAKNREILELVDGVKSDVRFSVCQHQVFLNGLICKNTHVWLEKKSMCGEKAALCTLCIFEAMSHCNWPALFSEVGLCKLKRAYRWNTWYQNTFRTNQLLSVVFGPKNHRWLIWQC